KSKLGANSILSVSMAVCKASTMHKSVTLYKRISELSKSKIRIPVPCFNIINGGVHAGNKLEVQEFMIMPVGAKTFKQAMQIGSEVYWELKKIISKKYGKNSVNVGDEGGFAPPLKNSREALDLIMSALKKTGYLKKTSIGMDCAASEFYKKGKYKIDGKSLTREKLLDYYVQLVKKYPIISIEDPFAEDDFKGFSLITKKLGKKIQIVGDDLLVTNIKRIEKAVKEKACNSLLLKVNQIGTLTEALDAAKLAKKNKWSVMVSHRSGETEDSFIADLAVGIGAGQIKSGAPCRSERLAKYNQLLRIEEELGKRAKYAGKNFRKNA
ncbi:phosphopyruvate hydratase, partial [Candidatus Woesearchaeota archaeon]|nr:phosphopyruvate hydratase [Candidatus Woesearchaeota archaeon]